MSSLPAKPKAQGIDLNPLLAILMAALVKEFPVLIAKLIEKINGDDGDEGDNGDGDGGIVDPKPPVNPPRPVPRTPESLEAKVFWISRKNTPYSKGGGRRLISDAEKQRVVSGSDPLQAGDRVCFDVTPYDQHGIKYEGQKPLDLEHEVGGVGELQVQEDNDYTPVVLVPWEGDVVKPGYVGTISYAVRGYREDGHEITSNSISLRVKPWAA
jgi:hypothetical protein